MSVLFAWLGNQDLDASVGKAEGLGPIADAAVKLRPERLVVLSAQPADKALRYEKWLRSTCSGTEVLLRQTDIADPWAFARIYEESARAVESEASGSRHDPEITFHLSPGTGAMSAAWIILSKTRFQARLIQSSSRNETGEYPIGTVDLPFDLSIELIGDLLRKPGDDLARLAQALPPANADFGKIIYRSPIMDELVLRARRVSLFGNVPVLILGDSGTGKELLARAIHTASPRAKKPFIPLNCGAIAPSLLESQLFGHAKGAFTGAAQERAGIFESATGGTIFLDEVGELPPPAQVALLRVLQEKTITRVGETHERPVDIRIIAATNRDLLGGSNEGGFRLDLLHRLAVGVLKVPPLRERPQDIDPIADHIMETLAMELARDLPTGPARLTPSARRRLREHSWPGNVRELQNTLLRAVVWTADESIRAQEIASAILIQARKDDGFASRALGDGFSLPALIDEVRQLYLRRALEESAGNNTRAARLLGISRQTLANWQDP